MDEEAGSRVRRTTDLSLSPLRTGDVALLVAIETDPRANLHSPTGPPTSEEAEALLLSVVAAWDAGYIHYWAFEHEEHLVLSVSLDDHVEGIARHVV